MQESPEKIALAYGAKATMLALCVFGIPALLVSLTAFLIFVPKDRIMLAAGISVSAVIIAGVLGARTFDRKIKSFPCPVCGKRTKPVSEKDDAAILWKCTHCERTWSSGLARPIYPDLGN
jgi:hypothetical protein